MIATFSANLGQADHWRDFLDELLIKHGSPQLFGTFFFEAVTKAREAGIEIVFGDFETLVALNAANARNWPPLIPLFDPEFGDLGAQNAFCIFGINRSNEVVATHAGRLFDWTYSHFAEEAQSLRLFYADPARMKLEGEACSVSASTAEQVRGRVVYSGAAWIRPDYRGRGLSSIFPRIGKVFPYTLWRPDYIVSLMTEETWRRGLSGRVGYSKVDWAVNMRNSRIGTRRFALLSMKEACILRYAEEFLMARSSKIDVGILDRGTQHPMAVRRIAVG